MNDSGKLVLRLALGLLVLLHGIAKLRHGIGAITGMVGGAGLPAWVAYGVYIGEVAAPLMVIAGWYARIGGAIIAINMGPPRPPVRAWRRRGLGSRTAGHVPCERARRGHDRAGAIRGERAVTGARGRY